MAKKEPVVIGGQPVGRLRASWLLCKESWRFLNDDREMLWIPVITALMALVAFGVLVTVFITVVMTTDYVSTEASAPSSPIELLFLFAGYVLAAFTVAVTQAAIAHTVYTRTHGNNATLGESLKVAFSHTPTLLMWSVITSTVGLILRMIAERSRVFGWIVTLIIGAAWSVLTYFVVPAMVIDKKSAFGSIQKSGQTFRATWGETIVSNITLGLVFFIAHVVAILATIGLVVLSYMTGFWQLMFVPVGLYVVWVIAASLIQSVLESVLRTLLYVYATEGTVPLNFNAELLEKIMSRKTPVAVTSAPSSTVENHDVQNNPRV